MYFILELFRVVREEGAQWVARHNREAVVGVPAEEYERLTATAGQPRTLVQFFRQSPLAGVRLGLERDKDAGQEIEL